MHRSGKPVDLSPMEYRILEYLIHRPRVIVSKRELLEHLYDYNWEHHSNVIEAHVSNLRRKLDAADAAAQHRDASRTRLPNDGGQAGEPMRPYSLTRRLIIAVLLVELLSALAITGLALVYERHTQFHAFDIMLRGRADSLLGAVQDAGDTAGQRDARRDGAQPARQRHLRGPGCETDASWGAPRNWNGARG